MHILTINNDTYGFLYIDQLVKYLLSIYESVLAMNLFYNELDECILKKLDQDNVKAEKLIIYLGPLRYKNLLVEVTRDIVRLANNVQSSNLNGRFKNVNYFRNGMMIDT